MINKLQIAKVVIIKLKPNINRFEMLSFEVIIKAKVATKSKIKITIERNRYNVLFFRNTF